MKQAWTLWFAAVVGFNVPGCQIDTNNPWKRGQQKVTSDPVKDQLAADATEKSSSAQVDTSKEPPPGGVDALSLQVKSFVGRLPAGDGNSAAKPTSETVKPAAEPTKTAAAPAPKPVPSAPTAVTANAPAKAQPVEPAKPVAHEIAASPKPTASARSTTQPARTIPRTLASQARQRPLIPIAMTVM